MSHTWQLVLLILIVLMALGWYLSYSAARLDRLHSKVLTARTALQVQLVRRAAAAVEAAPFLDPASAMVVTDAAARAMTTAEREEVEAARSGRDPLTVPPDLETVESDLTRALRAAIGQPPDSAHPYSADPFAQDAFEQVADAGRRVQLARRFHNDAVAQAQRVRSKRVVRWARLAGHAPLPQMIEFDDEMAVAAEYR